MNNAGWRWNAPMVFLLVVAWVQGPYAKSQSDSPDTPQAPVTVAVPRLIQFRGVLRDATGEPLRGTVEAVFLLYEEQEGGDPLWRENLSLAFDEQGRYTALLGSTQPEGLPEKIFRSVRARWLGIQIQGEEQERPRIILSSVPYALKAGDAETLGGKPASAYVLAENQTTNGSGGGVEAQGTAARSVSGQKSIAPISPTPLQVGGTGTTNYLAMFIDATDVGNSVAFQSGSNIGIGTATPGATLDVVGNLNVQNSSGQSIFQVLPSGILRGGVPGGSFDLLPSAASNGNLVLQPASAANSVFAIPSTSNQSRPLLVSRAGSGQTGSLFEAQNSSGFPLFSITASGAATVGPAGTATSSQGFNSNPLNLAASAFNSSRGAAQNETFVWQAAPLGNNTSAPSAALGLLFGSQAQSPAPTGLTISSAGTITFVPGQTFPGTALLGSSNSFSAPVSFTASSPSASPVKIVGASGQTSSLLDVVDSSGLSMFHILPGGTVEGGGSGGAFTIRAGPNSNGNLVLSPGLAVGSVLAMPSATNQTGPLMVARQGTGQTGPMFQAQDASGDPLVTVNPASNAVALLRIQNPAGTDLLRVEADGRASVGAGINPFPGSRLYVLGDPSNSEPLIVDSQSTQTVDLQTWRLNGAVKAAMTSTGAVEFLCSANFECGVNFLNSGGIIAEYPTGAMLISSGPGSSGNQIFNALTGGAHYFEYGRISKQFFDGSGLTFNNGQTVFFNDSGGTRRPVLQGASDNSVAIGSLGAGINLKSAAGSTLMAIAETGDVTVGGGVAPDGGGLKHLRQSTGSIGASGSATISLNWTTAFPDSNYTPACSVTDSSPSGAALRVHHIQSVTAAALSVLVVNDDGSSPHTGTLNCVAIHD